jgi:hypothetical protein
MNLPSSAVARRWLAYAIVRLVDSFVYGDIIAGVEVDHATASKVIRSLL